MVGKLEFVLRILDLIVGIALGTVAMLVNRIKVRVGFVLGMCGILVAVYKRRMG